MTHGTGATRRWGVRLRGSSSLDAARIVDDFAIRRAATACLVPAANSCLQAARPAVRLSPFFALPMALGCALTALPVDPATIRPPGAARRDHAPTDAFVDVAGLGLVYADGADVLAGISLRVRRGGFVAVVGSGGCGKYSLLKVIAGLPGGACRSGVGPWAVLSRRSA